MKKYFILMTLALAFSACTENGQDDSLRLSETEASVKTALKQDLLDILKKSINEPEVAAIEFQQIGTHINSNIPDVLSEPDMVLYSKYVKQGIDLGRFKSKLDANLKNIDFANFDRSKLESNDYLKAFKIPPSDIGLLLQFQLQTNNRYNSLSDTWDLMPKRDETFEKVLSDNGAKVVNGVNKKLESYNVYTGKEEQIVGKTFQLKKYQLNMMNLQMQTPPFFQEDGLWDMHLSFEQNHVFKCDSLWLPFIAGKTYGSTTDLWKIIYKNDQEPDQLIRSGKEFVGDGEYYFGDNYLILVFNLKAGYIVAITTQYNTEKFEASEQKLITPLRSEKAKGWGVLQGQSTVWLSTFNVDKNFGTYQQADHSYMYLPNYKLAPFTLIVPTENNDN